jgi:glycosyltransferase involved in cell wall biosynthesis
MKILFVLNNIFSHGNGLATSAKGTVKALRDAGQDVRVLSCENLKNPQGPQPYYRQKEFVFPIFQPLVKAHGYSFAKWTGPNIEEAVRWADVVHIEEPFFIEHAAMNWAKKLGKPLTATYHMHPENMFFSLGMGDWSLPNNAMLRYWVRIFLNNCLYVQCPTENVRERLNSFHVKANCVTISNGLIPDKCIRPTTPPEDYYDENRPLDVIYIGRLSGEKDQPTLMEAMRYSKYANRIRLRFAGLGPKQKQYQQRAENLYEEGILKHKPTFEFLNRDQLRELAANADLAVHCATIEVEGLSIMEAMQQAVVPVIATAPYSGTSVYALDDRSKFPAKDAKALAERIDYWLDHPQERWEMGFKYAESMEKYDIAISAKRLIEMFEAAIENNKTK